MYCFFQLPVLNLCWLQARSYLLGSFQSVAVASSQPSLLPLPWGRSSSWWWAVPELGGKLASSRSSRKAANSAGCFFKAPIKIHETYLLHFVQNDALLHQNWPVLKLTAQKQAHISWEESPQRYYHRRRAELDLQMNFMAQKDTSNMTAWIQTHISLEESSQWWCPWEDSRAWFEWIPWHKNMQSI